MNPIVNFLDFQLNIAFKLHDFAELPNPKYYTDPYYAKANRRSLQWKVIRFGFEPVLLKIRHLFS